MYEISFVLPVDVQRYEISSLGSLLRSLEELELLECELPANSEPYVRMYETGAHVVNRNRSGEDNLWEILDLPVKRWREELMEFEAPVEDGALPRVAWVGQFRLFGDVGHTTTIVVTKK